MEPSFFKTLTWVQELLVVLGKRGGVWGGEETPL